MGLLGSCLLTVSSWKYLETTFISFYNDNNNLVVQRRARARQWSFTPMFLTELSPCDSLLSIFKYVPTRGKLAIKSKRSPLFSPASAYEPLKVLKEAWEKQTIHGIPLFTKSLKLLEQISAASSLASWGTVWSKKRLSCSVALYRVS